ncbi:hypothetical protein F750_5700 [Streptomyces sp. PAMC 26508]|nr:hypothetical protein F750_5700 [Streptomyces sp. PAMC 26508]
MTHGPLTFTTVTSGLAAGRGGSRLLGDGGHGYTSFGTAGGRL